MHPSKLEHKLKLNFDGQEDIPCIVYYNYWPPRQGYHDGVMQLEPDSMEEIEIYSIKSLGCEREEIKKFSSTEIEMIEQMIWKNEIRNK